MQASFLILTSQMMQTVNNLQVDLSFFFFAHLILKIEVGEDKNCSPLCVFWLYFFERMKQVRMLSNNFEILKCPGTG